MRKLSLIVLVTVMALSLVLIPSHTAKTEARQDTLKIGVITDRTGLLAVYGIELENGFALGLDYATGGTMEVAGRPIEIIVRDYGGDAVVAAEQAVDLIEGEGVEILVGAPSSDVTQGLVAIAADYGVILMAGPAAAKNLTGDLFEETTFRACRNSWHDAMALAPYWVDAIGETYVQFAADYSFGREAAEAFDYMLQQYDATPVQDTIYGSLTLTEFGPFLDEIMDSGADGVIYIWAGAGTIPLVQQIDEAGVTDEMAAIGFFNSNDIMVAFADAQEIPSDGFIIYHYTLPDNEINDWLVQQHIERFDGDVPDLFTECGFATGQAIVAGLENSEGSTFVEDLVPALEGLEWEGPKGTYYLRAEDHQAVMPMYAVRLTNLDDPEFRFYERLDVIEIDPLEMPCEAGADRSSDELDCTPVTER
ncbi:MAG: ABC transporter substrate-binding protein [Chloroflexi bacterium]|nr:ABC transporter substrate-binding protein [Chloroflexota bacterium]